VNQESYLATLRCYSQTFPSLRVRPQDYSLVKQNPDQIIDLGIKSSYQGQICGNLNADKSKIHLPFEGQITRDKHGRFSLSFIKLEGSVDTDYSLMERSAATNENKNVCYLEGTWHPDPYIDSRYKGLACIDVLRSDLEQLL